MAIHLAGGQRKIKQWMVANQLTLITCWYQGLILSPCGDEEYRKKSKEIFPSDSKSLGQNNVVQKHRYKNVIQS